MFNLTFPKSRSKHFAETIKEAKKFDTCIVESNSVTVEVLVKDIFERWDSFCIVFQNSFPWNGSYIEYNGLKYYSKSDRKRIFYSIHQAHTRWINNVGYIFENSDLIYTGDETLDNLERQMMIEHEIDRLLDLLFPNINGDD